MNSEDISKMIREAVQQAVSQSVRMTMQVGGETAMHSLLEDQRLEMENMMDGLPNTAGMDAMMEGGGGAATANPRPFDVESMNETAVTLVNCLYQVGGVTYDAGTQTVAAGAGYIALKMKATGDSPSAEVAYYATIEAMQAAQADKDYYIRPLYRMAAETSSSGKVTLSVELDVRSMPDVQMYEF